MDATDEKNRQVPSDSCRVLQCKRSAPSAFGAKSTSNAGFALFLNLLGRPAVPAAWKTVSRLESKLIARRVIDCVSLRSLVSHERTHEAHDGKSTNEESHISSVCPG
jgi:hypothetical protein